MEIKEYIKRKIENSDRNDIVYIHPIIPLEKIAQYISAFANSNGGIIVFGVKDDGNKLLVKNSVFKITEQKLNLKKLLDRCIDFTVGSYYENEACKLEYIQVKKSNQFVYLNGDIFVINDSNNRVEKLEQKTVFLSYCQKDSCIADLVEENIGIKLRAITVTRDVRDVKYKESFSEFMQSIGQHDFVITIISDKYLKSRNCMYEALEVMRDRKFHNKLLFIVISDNDITYYNKMDLPIKANIYSIEGQTEYLKYWQSEEEKIIKYIEAINNPLLSGEHVEELKIIKKIQIDIQEFMRYLRDRKGVSLEDMINSEFKEIRSIIEK